MYSVQCTVYNVQCTMYSVQCTVYNVQCTLDIHWNEGEENIRILEQILHDIYLHNMPR